MGATLTLTLTCALFWLPGPEGPRATPPPAGGASRPGKPEAGTSDAERIARLQRMLEADRKHLADMKAQLEDPGSEYDSAEKAFGECDAKKKGLEKALQELPPEGNPEERASRQQELSELEPKWKAAKDRFELAIQERKARQEAVVTLEKKIHQDEQALAKLTAPSMPPPEAAVPGGGPAEGSVPPRGPEAGPPAPPPPAGTPPAASPPGSAPGTPPAAVPGGTPPDKPSEAKPEVAKPPTKELVEARRDAQVKEETARKAEAKARSLTARIEALQASIRSEEKLRETSRKKSDQADSEKTDLEKELKKKLAAGAPEKEIQGLWEKLDQVQARIREARAESRASSDRLRDLSADLVALQAEHIAALREAEEKTKAAVDARKKVTELQHPFHPTNVLQWGINHGPPLALIVAAVFFLRWLARVSSGRIVRLLARSGPTKRGSAQDRENRADTLAGVFHNTATLFIFGGGALMLLDEVGVPIVPLMGGAAVLGLAVAFGAQNLIKDYFSGFMVLVEDQYAVKDVVRIGDVAGQVEHISLRMTVVRDVEGIVHFVPHGTIQTVSNLTHGWSRALFDISVAYKEDVDKVMKILVEVGQELRHDPRYQAVVLEGPEMLGVNEFSDSSVVIRFFLKTVPLQQWPVKREMLRRIKKRFDEEGIEIPFPHRTVYHRCEDGPVVLAWDEKQGNQAA